MKPQQTPEEIIHQIKDNYAKSVDFDDFDDLYLSGTMTEGDINKLMKSYHTAMLQSSIPSEEEIVSKGKEWLKETGWHDADLFSYKKGFKDALTLLTKGDR